jgi:hypothetical protein
VAIDYDQIRTENELDYGRRDHHLALLSQLYSDRTHFIFELIQNAEDAGATSLSFELHLDALEVRHNGRPFDEADVRGICGVAESTKADDLTKIGRFGIGFKSVYAFTARPEIHSAHEHFCVESFVRPHAISVRSLAPGETLFRFPFDQVDVIPAEACEEIGVALNMLDVTTLLFLKNVERITVDGEGIEPDVLERSTQHEAGVRQRISLRDRLDGECTRDWYVWDRPVQVAEGSALRVQLAFALGAGGEVRRLPESPLAVFFPTAKETHLGFIIQGPYRTTPARDNVPEGDPLNKALIEETAILVRTVLIDLRDEGLLTVDVLSALPLDGNYFQPGTMFHPILESVRGAFTNEELIPVTDGGYARAADVRLARGTGLRELFDPRQFAEFLGRGRPVRWVTDEVTDTRSPLVRRFLREALGVSEVTPESIVNGLSEVFLLRQPDEWMIKLYRFLGTSTGLVTRHASLPAPALYSKPILRLEDGTHVTPSKGVYLPTGRPTSFPCVRAAIAADADALRFLTSLGLVEPDASAEVLDHVLPRYRNRNPCDMTWAEHEADLSLVKRALNETAGSRADLLQKQLSDTPFLRTLNAANGDTKIGAPGLLHRPSPSITTYFEGNPQAWLLGPEYEPWLDMLRSVGLRDGPKVFATAPDRERHVLISRERGDHRRGLDAFDPRASIEGLEFACANPTLGRARYIWNELLSPNRDLVAGVVEACSRQNFVGATRTHQRSRLGEIVVTHAWLPGPNDTWVRPTEIGLDDLPHDFTRDERLARSLGMALPITEEVASAIGIPADRLRRLQQADPDALDAFLAEQEHSADAVSVPDADGDAAPLHYPDALIEAFSRPTRTPAERDELLSDGSVANPTLRRARVGEAIATERADEPSERDRFRPVPRKVWAAKDNATRHFVEEQYRGRCQICKDTFTKRNGEPYFEAVYLVQRVRAKWVDRPGNVLCLCASCGAKLHHGPVDVGDLIEQLDTWRTSAEGGGPAALHITMCGEAASIHYTEKHLLDLQEMAASGPA